MAGRPLSTVLGLLALAALGQCLNCNVCIPPLAGDKPSQKEAEIWRAKIGRTFPGMAVSDIQTPIFRTEEPLWFLETAWCSQTQMGLSESTVWDLQSLMGARQMWTLGDAGMGPSEMPVCGEKVDPNKKPKETEGSCPWNTDDVVCLKIKHDSSWYALTCGQIPADEDLSCYTEGGSYICPCPNSYCNSRGWRDAASSTALISLLLGLTLAAAW
ncbi:hypothetical protein FJT64_001372 [Amphibalanus amphitrite]|uniref:Uncharacterized protein n=1 Tax=Amphibalanus amphitrite TaxID=1232801 RepID=A0A6A4V516_AMPAM|nr:hypothetical protein FJT64_001372 [Amphibalanus amphitrite]